MGGLAVLAALADDDAPVGRPHHPAGTGPPALAGSLPGWRVLARDAWGARAGWVARPARAHPIGAAGRWRRPRAGAAPAPARRPVQSPRPHRRPASTGGRDRRPGRSQGGRPGTRSQRQRRRGHRGDGGSCGAARSPRGDGGELVVSMPIPRRAQGEAGSLGNPPASCLRVPAVPDPEIRLRHWSPSVTGSQPVVGASTSCSPRFPRARRRRAFQAFVDHQRLVHTFVTNCVGQLGGSAGGRRGGRHGPRGHQSGNVAVSFDVLSYAGTPVVTLVCDPGPVPESAWLAGAWPPAYGIRVTGIRPAPATTTS